MNPNLNEPARHEVNEASFPRPAQKQPMRGHILHRMGEDAGDERAVAEFWRAHGLDVVALEDPMQTVSRHPDLLLSQAGTPWAVCEVKTIWRHGWKVRISHEECPVEVRENLSFRPVGERLSGDLITAIRQLNGGNPSHELLNFVVLVNFDPEATPDLMEQLLAKQAHLPERTVEARRAAKLAQELQDFRHGVDLCLWASPIAPEKFVIERCFLFNPTLRSFAEEVSGLRGSQVVSLDPAA
ncbi:MAG: hypothetical protein ACLGSH_17575 [Acidobacteriota bacterium]